MLKVLSLGFWLWVVSAGGAYGLQSQEASAADPLTRARDLYLAGQIEAAGEALEQILAPLRESGPSRELGDALNILSLVRSSLGDYRQGYQLARESAEVRIGLGDPVGAARSLNNMGLALQYQGDYEESLQAYREALEFDRRNQDREGQVLRLNNIGNIYFYQARYSEALESYQEALLLVDAGGEDPWIRPRREMTIVNLAVLQQKLGRYQRALELYSLVRSESGGLSPREDGLALSNLGALFRRMGDPYQAIDYYRQALERFREDRDLDAELGTLKNLGIAYAQDLQQADRALELFYEVLRAARASQNRREQLQALLYIAEALRRLARLDQGHAALEQALELAHELGTPEEEWQALLGLGKLAEAGGDPVSARQLYERMIAVIESARARLAAGSSESAFLANKRSAYDALISVLIGHGNDSVTVDQLGELIEKARSQVFLSRFRKGIEDRERRESPEIYQRRKELRERIANLWSRQLEADPEQRQEIRSELALLENEYSGLESRTQQRISGLSAWPGSEELQDALPAGAGLLELWSDESRWLAIWLTHRRAERFGAAWKPGQREALQKCSQSSVGRSEGGPGSCQDLALLLIPELEPRLEGLTNLIVAPGSAFSNLPLESLPLSGGEYLVERVAVSYLPSVALLTTKSSDSLPVSPWPWTRVLLAAGAPVFEDSGESDRQWAPLPFAEAEIRAIDADLPGEGELLLGVEALKPRWVEGAARSPAVVHLATHAFAESADADRSRILFASAPGRDEADFLFLGEIARFELGGTQLVTLSACETALGEDVQTFPQAFLLAGAESVVATLWKVPDQATFQFMREFYRNLARGLSRSQALREAKVRFIESGSELAEPYYWAGFVLWGEGHSSLRLPYSWRHLLLIGMGVAVLATLLLAGWRRLRRAGVPAGSER